MKALLRPFFSNCSIRAFILRISFVFSALGFGLIYLGATQAYDSAVWSSAEAMVERKAEQTFADMYAVMRKGWSRAELEAFLVEVKARNANTDQRITIYRGPVVAALYGAIEQPELDPLLLQSLESGRKQQQANGYHLRFSYPLVAAEACLKCHHNAAVGTVLGVIEVRQELGPLLVKARNGLLVNLLWMAPIPFLLAWLVVRYLNRRINHSINLLEEQIGGIESVSDLNQFRLQSNELGFTDLNRILARVEGLAGKMRTIAVDKELLEFEIRLLERFVITSEVVKDWHEYVSQMLVEINHVLCACNLFTIFKVDDEVLALEIFWLAPPTATTRNQLEQAIRSKLANSPHFSAAAIAQVNHHVSNPDAAPVTLDPQTIEFQTKSLLLDVPCIGGIVGIGVHADTIRDETRLLVLESILSTLLNVVGSVKAIYKYTQDLEYYATRDPLTDLYNQRLFWEMLGYEINRSSRHGDQAGLLLIDMDNFKTINDSFGHNFGDGYLEAFAKSLKSALRAGDILARYGGDEFVIILPESDLEQTAMVGRRVLQAIANLSLNGPTGEPIRTTASIGMAVYPDHADTPKDLFMFADNIMYKAKSQGKNRICVPSEDDVLAVFQDLSEKTRIITAAIDNKQITPYFQPIMGINNGRVEAVEVLSRIQLDNGEVLGAHQFIEIAESMGLIHSLDFVVIERALAQVRQENFQGLVFINLSPRSLVLAEFLPRVCAIVDGAGIERSRIVFEMTERDTVKNLSLLERLVVNLKAEGYQLAVDDFGSGFSSFHYLKRFPIDYVKIEGEFVANMTASPKDASVVRCISELARDMGAKTVAEFVESDEVLEAVRGAKIDLGQGYHIGRPQPWIFPPQQASCAARESA